MSDFNLNNLFNALRSEMDTASDTPAIHADNANAIDVAVQTQAVASPAELPVAIAPLRLNLKSLLCEAGCYSGVAIATFQGIDRYAPHLSLPSATIATLGLAISFTVAIAQTNKQILRAWRHQDVQTFNSSMREWNLSLHLMQESIAKLVLVGQIAIAIFAGWVVSLVV